MKYSLLNADDDQWRFLRNTLLPTFSSGKMRMVPFSLLLLLYVMIDKPVVNCSDCATYTLYVKILDPVLSPSLFLKNWSNLKRDKFKCIKIYLL